MAKRPSLDAEGPSDSKEIPRSLDPVLRQMCPHTEPGSGTDVSLHIQLLNNFNMILPSMHEAL